MTEGDIIRILIADDHPIFRDGMRGLLESLADTEVVGEAETGDEVIALTETLQPDVILMDLKMPSCNGIEATRRILQTSPHIGVLVVTMFEDDDSVFAAMLVDICSRARARPRRCERSGRSPAVRRSSVRRSPAG
jgi:DNA-binding NarL/FixJ family response regulator